VLNSCLRLVHPTIGVQRKHKENESHRNRDVSQIGNIALLLLLTFESIEERDILMWSITYTTGVRH